MSHIHHVWRSLADLPRHAGVLLAYAAAAPAALEAAPARPPGRHTHPPLPPGWAHRPHLPPGWNKHPPLPAHLHPIAGGSMPGWQITQLAAAVPTAGRAAAYGLGRRLAGTAPMTAFGLLPHPVQLRSHCRANPAGFWVRRTSAAVVRRPWCLTCCGELDPARFHVIAFDAAPHTRPQRHAQPGPPARPFPWPRARPPRRPPS